MNPEPKTPQQKIKIDSKLIEGGDYLKLHLSEKQDTGPHTDYWSTQRVMNSINYQWKDKVESQLGRMHYEDHNDLLYPTIPVFENFARATVINTDPIAKINKKYIYTEEPVSEEEIVKKMLSSMKLQELAMSSAKSTLQKMFKEGLEEGDLLEAEAPEKSLNAAVEKVFADIEFLLLGEIRQKARNVKLTRKRRKTLDETELIPHLSFLFKNGLSVEMDGECAKLFSLLLPVIQMLQERRRQILEWRNGGVKNGDFDYEVRGKYQPMDHQKVMYKIHLLLNHSADLSQMGTGKTYSALMVIDKRIQLGLIRPGHILIICPATILENWLYREMATHTPHLTGKIITGSYNDRLQMILNPDVDIFLTNFETFSMKTKMDVGGKELNVPLGALFRMNEWDMVVIDEAHKIKNPEAQRTKQIIKTFRGILYTMIMSGTINANKLYDLHTPFVFLNGAKQFNSLHQERGSGELFTHGKLHEQFVSHYFSGNGYKKTPLPFTVEELRERMEEISVRYEKKECLDLPEKMYEQRMIDMGDKQAQLYIALKNFLCAQLQDTADSGGTVTIMNILSMMVKLAEAANGWIYDDNHELISLPENPKLDALLDVVSDLNEDDKVVVWSRFTNDLHVIAAALEERYGKDAVAVIHGGESCSVCGSRKDERYSITERFNDLESSLKYVVVNQAVGSHGINLTGATYEIFFSNSFVKTDRSQAEDRCHRKGMRDNLTIIDLVMKETVDVDVLLALKSWKSMTAALLGHLGIDATKLFPADGVTKNEEAPQIIEHISQRPGECALATIAMLSNTPVELVRSYMTVQLNDPKAYKGTREQIMVAVKRFIPQMEAQWSSYSSHLEEAKVSLELKEIPKTGTGALVIRHEKSQKIAHAVAYSEGFVYDPGRGGKVEREKYETWMVSAKYYVEWVFPTEGTGVVMKVEDTGVKTNAA